MRHSTLRSAVKASWLGCIVMLLVACQPNPTPTTPIPPTLTVTPPGGLSINVIPSPIDNPVPMGSSMSYALELKYPDNQAPQAVTWETQMVPTGMTAEIVGHTSPWQTRLVVTTDGSLAAGRHTLDVVATTDTNQSVRVGVTVILSECVQTASGIRTDGINLNLVELITAGKPAVEHGLLVPVQICGSAKHIRVILKEEIAEDTTVMTTPMPFYLFRSEVYPAPKTIIAHGIPELYNVQVPNIVQTNTTTQLDADVPSGLYLLIFEHDRFGATLTPSTRPAFVTYDLQIN